MGEDIFQRGRLLAPAGQAEGGFEGSDCVRQAQLVLVGQDGDFAGGNALRERGPAEHGLVCDGRPTALGDAIAFGKADLALVDDGDGEADNLFIRGQLADPRIQAVIVNALSHGGGKGESGGKADNKRAQESHVFISSFMARPGARHTKTLRQCKEGWMKPGAACIPGPGRTGRPDRFLS